MRFLGIDPGKTTGVAWWDTVTESWDAHQTTDPYEAMDWLEEIWGWGGHLNVTVERFTGGGYKTAEGNYTSELAGWFKHHFEYTHGFAVRYANSNQRLSGMDKVKELNSLRAIPVAGPHSHDALAHAIVHSRLPLL